MQVLNNDFFPIVEAAKKIKHQVILDGEIVILDSEGKADFQALQDWKRDKNGRLTYEVFDLLYLDGHDLTGLALKERKEILKKLINGNPIIKYCDHVEDEGVGFFHAAIELGLEGIMAKDGSSRYLPGIRSWSWQKIKNFFSQEAVVVGYTEPREGRKYLGALILGAYDNKGELKYIGHTGGGFSDKQLKKLLQKLEKIEQPNSAFSNKIKTNAPAHWVKPGVVVEVRYAQKTKEGYLRQPVFLRLRDDVEKDEVLLEKELNEEKTIDDQPRLSNPRKVLWTKEGYTKKDLYNYYEQISRYILPHLENRPVTLIRYPNGIESDFFYQKNMDYNLPKWAETIKINHENEQVNYLLIQNVETLLYAVNLATIDFNPWLSRVTNLDCPDYLVIDLDPLEIEFRYVVKTALAVKLFLDNIGIKSYPKTSGATGMHIYIPLEAKYNYDQAKDFAKIIISLVHDETAEFTSTKRSPAKRKGKVYLDYLQNIKGQTVASAYSVRPVKGATVSTPLFWDEVNEKLNPADYNIETIMKRVNKIGDIFSPVLGEGNSISDALDNIQHFYN